MGWRNYGDVPIDLYKSEFRRFNSPMLAEVDAIYKALRGHTAFALAVMFEEQKYATKSSIPSDRHNPFSLAKPDGTPEMGVNRWEKYADWTAGAYAFLARILSPSYKGGVYARTNSIEEFVHVYAPGNDDNDEAQYVAVLKERLSAFGARETKMAKQIVVLTAGHRSTNDSGTAGEKVLTGEMAKAIKIALEKAGHEVHYLQGGYPNEIVPGGLDDVGRLTRQLMTSTQATVLIDCHYEGNAPSVRGCFAIVPDSASLVTAIPGGASPTDSWTNNPLDVSLARAISKALSQRTGIPLRTAGVREPGVMSETQTGVASQYNARLAMFAYTIGQRERAVRLVVEHGALTNSQDSAIIHQDDFTERAADAYVEAFNAVFGLVNQPIPTKPKYAKRHAPKLPATTYVDPQGNVWIKFNKTMVAKKGGAPALEFAFEGSDKVAADFPEGKRANFVYVLVPETGGVYLVSKGGTRTPISSWTDG